MKVSFLPAISIFSFNWILPSGVSPLSFNWILFLVFSPLSFERLDSTFTCWTLFVPNNPCKNPLKESELFAPTVIPVAQTNTTAKLTIAHFIFLKLVNLILKFTLSVSIDCSSNSFFQLSGVLIVSNFFKFIFASILQFLISFYFLDLLFYNCSKFFPTTS